MGDSLCSYSLCEVYPDVTFVHVVLHCPMPVSGCDSSLGCPQEEVAGQLCAARGYLEVCGPIFPVEECAR